jgi:hypothetical protein
LGIPDKLQIPALRRRHRGTPLLNEFEQFSHGPTDAYLYGWSDVVVTDRKLGVNRVQKVASDSGNHFR